MAFFSAAPTGCIVGGTLGGPLVRRPPTLVALGAVLHAFVSALRVLAGMCAAAFPVGILLSLFYQSVYGAPLHLHHTASVTPKCALLLFDFFRLSCHINGFLQSQFFLHLQAFRKSGVCKPHYDPISYEFIMQVPILTVFC